MTPDIRQWRTIDAPWLSAALSAGGVEARVRDFTAARVGTGQIGDCVRFNLDYETAPPGAPASLVGKFPSEAEESRATGVSLGNYYREVRFYQVLQERAGISTPRCYFTDVDEASHDFVLIMEDMAPAEQGDQLAGVGIETARQVIVEAAKLHAAFWEDDTLDDYPWVSGSKGSESPLQPDAVAALWDGFKARYGARVTPLAARIGDAMAANLAAYDALREGPRTLVHADFRPDNMLFASAGAARPVTVVDWQSFGYGPGAADVGYFIAGALAPEVRRANEAALLALYAGEMEQRGAGPYAPDVLKRHYVAGAFQHFLTAFFAAMLVTQTDRGDDMFFKMLNGAVELASDHGAEGWFD